MSSAPALTRALVFIGALLWGPQVQAQLVCTPEFAKSLDSPEVLRAVAEKCEDDTATFAAAIVTLNSLPPPRPPSLSFKQPVDHSRANRAILATELYYFMYESYPHPVGLKRLQELLAQMGTAFEVERVEVTGFQDPNEQHVPPFRVAEKRAEFIRKFFIAAGVPEGVLFLATRDPIHPDTVDGRARDRSASIRVVMLRERSTQGEAPGR